MGRFLEGGGGDGSSGTVRNESPSGAPREGAGGGGVVREKRTAPVQGKGLQSRKSV
jgi:hypothetical protein